MEALGTVKSVPVEQIGIAQNQPRKYIDPVALDEMADSIIEHGLVHPILLRPNPAGGRIKYLIVAGQRRWRAHQRAYEKTRDVHFLMVTSCIRDMTEAEATALTVTENLHREDLTPLEEAMGFLHLKNDRQAQGLPCTDEAIGSIISKHRTYVANSIRLLQLDPATIALANKHPDAVARGHLVPLVGLRPADQVALLQRAVAGERTVRQIETDAKLCRERYDGEKKNKKDTDVLHLLMRNLSQHVSSHIGNPTDIARFKDGKYRFEANFHSAAEMEGFLERLGIQLGEELHGQNASGQEAERAEAG